MCFLVFYHEQECVLSVSSLLFRAGVCVCVCVCLFVHVCVSCVCILVFLCLDVLTFPDGMGAHEVVGSGVQVSLTSLSLMWQK